MAEALDAIVALAADGSALTCTLSPESVQVIFFALALLEDMRFWVSGDGDTVTDEERDTILEMLAECTEEILP